MHQTRSQLACSPHDLLFLSSKIYKLNKINVIMNDEQLGFQDRVTKNLKPIKVRPITDDSPLVTWGVISTLNRHNWIKRVMEYLTEDPQMYLEGSTEMVLLFTQDEGAAAKAAERIDNLATLLGHMYPSARHRVDSIRVVEDYQGDDFFLDWARLRLLQETSGDFILFLDADTALTGHNFSLASLRYTLHGSVSLLGYPSLKDYKPFKPRVWEPTLRSLDHPGIIIAHGIHEIATFSPSNLERTLYRNVGNKNNGEYLSLCTKYARAGHLMAYIDSHRGFMLSTSDGEATVRNLSSSNEGDGTSPEQMIGRILLAQFYGLDSNTAFGKRLREFYGVDVDNFPPDVLKEIEKRKPVYFEQQGIPP